MSNKIYDWHLWYAWHPIWTLDAGWIWFKYAYRRRLLAIDEDWNMRFKLSAYEYKEQLSVKERLACADGSMPYRRWSELEHNQKAELSQAEIEAGWHFCMDWDGLLIGPGMRELEHCHCILHHKVRNGILQ